LDTPDINAWQPWTPNEVYKRFAGIDAPWCVVGGWAIDLWLGEQTRPHDDIEISILREDLAQFRAALPDCEFFAAGSGKVTRLGPAEPATEIHQVWCLEKETKKWRLDIMIEPGSRQTGAFGTWHFKHDPSICKARNETVLRDWNGVPFMCPEVVLLFKAKNIRAKDQFDFESVLSTFHTQQYWLAEAIEKVYPRNPWIEKLRNFKNLTI
jgi:hypothetical protein